MTFPENFTQRAPSAEDVDTVGELEEVVARAVIGRGARATPSVLLNTWFGAEQDFSRSLEGAHLLVFAPNQTLIGYLETEAEPEASWFYFSIRIHPDFESDALYHGLRAQAEAWGQTWVKRQPPGDYRILTETWAQDKATQKRLESAGYQRVRIYHRMEIALDEPLPAPAPVAGYTIRSYRRGEDDRKIYDAWREAMADDWGATTSLSFDEFMFYNVNQRSDQDLALWRFAMDGEAIAGFTMSQWARAGDPDAGHIRTVGVRRAYRRKGLALALLRATFEEYYRLGKRRVSLGVDGYNANGAVRLYERVGMHVDLTQYKYGKALGEGKP